MLNFGIHESLIKIAESDFISGSLEKEVLQPSGQWDEYLPAFESQRVPYETDGCTVWGSQNQLETLLKRMTGTTYNYDERFNYVCIGIKQGGTNPNNAYQSYRHDGLIPQEDHLPPTYEEFASKSYLTPQRRKQGYSWLQNFELKHAWLKAPGSSITKQDIVNDLKYSPIGLTVTAWLRGPDGLYIDGGHPNEHWCLAYGYLTNQDDPNEVAHKYGVDSEKVMQRVRNGEIIIKIFDSYNQSHKLLDPDHHTAYAKVISIITLDQVRAEVSLITKIVNTLVNLFKSQALIKPTQVATLPVKKKL